MTLASFVIDVGSLLPKRGAPNGSFGWARAVSSSEVIGDTSMTTLLGAIATDVNAGHTIALGIEAPLWLPVPLEAARLSRGRSGDASRSCFAPAGGYVATLGLHQLAHVLMHLPAEITPTLDWAGWSASQSRKLLLWEAFVSGKAHAPSDTADAHVRDAATAAVEFLQRAGAGLRDGEVISDDRPVLSLAGTALLWSGRETDVAVMKRAPLVIRPGVMFSGQIGAARVAPQ